MSCRPYIETMRDRERISNHVRRHRALADGMTQQELAGRVGVSRQTIVAIEKGHYNPSVALAIRLARVFGVPVESLFEIEKGDDHG